MREYPFLPRYDFVSLLIGVNNQYRGMSETEIAPRVAEIAELTELTPLL